VQRDKPALYVTLSQSTSCYCIVFNWAKFWLELDLKWWWRLSLLNVKCNANVDRYQRAKRRAWIWCTGRRWPRQEGSRSNVFLAAFEGVDGGRCTDCEGYWVPNDRAAKRKDYDKKISGWVDLINSRHFVKGERQKVAGHETTGNHHMHRWIIILQGRLSRVSNEAAVYGCLALSTAG